MSIYFSFFDAFLMTIMMKIIPKQANGPGFDLEPDRAALRAGCNCHSGRCSADFLKKVKDGSFLRKRLLLSACFSRTKRLQKRFLTFKFLLNC